MESTARAESQACNEAAEQAAAADRAGRYAPVPAAEPHGVRPHASLAVVASRRSVYRGAQLLGGARSVVPLDMGLGLQIA